MTTEERAQILVTARLLRATTSIEWLTTGLTLLAAGAMTFGAPNRVAAVAAIALGLIAKLFGVRISFDASLFEDAAAGSLTASDLDAALGALALAPPGKAGRSWRDRCLGAKRLVLILAGVACAQTVAVTLLGIGG
jgi:hypothetical protein